ncbi:hypothetical protein FFI94_014960 [Rhodococcus sp. KBS0724]|jgi:predicted rRNA methylase YqxC with S4 and FtsJ domains|uniref:hypothetical protein n=1 Tax=Rhodococcus sp. KBS0724 TaxID=1179674 RepID=UPI00110ED532|nr:hypothetical protein [Rhodococcus sp. KBS0724]TSD47328.1 hypothetical protein FFI94_014960 [Rhodococcus sp. KBS0724]
MTSPGSVDLYRFLQDSGLAWSPEHAAALIMERLVTVNDLPVYGPRRVVHTDDVVGLVEGRRTAVVGDELPVRN